MAKISHVEAIVDGSLPLMHLDNGAT